MNTRMAYHSIGFIDGRHKENNVIYFLERDVALFPDKAVLKWVPGEVLSTWDGVQKLPHESISYRDFASKVARLAKGLKDAGITPGERVIIFLPMSFDLYMSICAVLRIGAVAVFLDPWRRREHLDICARRVEPKAMISFEAAFTLATAVSDLDIVPLKIVIGQHAQKYDGDFTTLLAAEEACIEPVEPNTPALITFTSGSSGVPKGAVRTHQFLAAQHKALDKCIPYFESDVDLPTFPAFSLNNLAGGVTTVLPAINLEESFDKNAHILISQIFSTNITCCTFSPSLLVNVTEYCHENHIRLSSVRRVVTGGAPIGKDTIRKFKSIAHNTEVLVLYGSTEVEPIAHIEANEILRDESGREGVNVGQISEDLEFKFIRIYRGNIKLSKQGWEEWEVAKGGVGELIVSGSRICQEYYRDLEAFKASKITESNGKVWHRTGDLGVLDKNKRLWIVGRVHNVIPRANTYLFPVHAEMILKTLEFVQQAAFVGIEDADLGEKACAVISLKPGYSVEHQQRYVEQIRNTLNENNIPVDEIRIIEEIPMDPRHHSKVEYTKLRQLLK